MLIYVPAQAGYVDILRRILQAIAAIEAKKPDGEIALHLVAERDHVITLELLLRREACIEPKTISNEIPLVCAARAGRYHGGKSSC